MGRAFVMDGNLNGMATPTIPFGMLINMGMAPYYSTVDKFGYNPVITTGSDPEDVIEQGGNIYYPARGTAPIRFISSSSAADVGQPINVYGNDINNNYVEQMVVTNGQNNVDLPTPLWRQWRMENESDDDGLDIQGILYCHADDGQSAGIPSLGLTSTIINGANNQTLFCGITIPRGSVAFLFKGEFGIELEGNASSLAEYAKVTYKSRRYGKRFKNKKLITLIVGGSAIYSDVRSFPDIIPPGTDVRLVIDEVSQTMGLWGAFDLILADIKELPDSYQGALKMAAEQY